MTSIERADLTQQRRKLRRDRHLKLLQSLWQTLAVSGILGGLVWGTIQPIWVLRQSNQIVISGNHLLWAAAIRERVPLSYPKWLLRIEPEAIARLLESQPAIAEATVTRQLFPPRITILVKERVPVALALPSPKASYLGLLDQNGVWMSIQSYTSLSTTQKLPSLKVIGQPEQYRPYWPQLYQAVSHSPIKVAEIDCQDPANLILKTELGIVHLGSYSSRLAEQLKVLAQMRQLSTQLNPSQIAYIDLKNPQSPLVQMNQANESVK
jgi:cell division protein FtsQ